MEGQRPHPRGSWGSELVVGGPGFHSSVQWKLSGRRTLPPVTGLQGALWRGEDAGGRPGQEPSKQHPGVGRSWGASSSSDQGRGRTPKGGADSKVPGGLASGSGTRSFPSSWDFHRGSSSLRDQRSQDLDRVGLWPVCRRRGPGLRAGGGALCQREGFSESLSRSGCSAPPCRVLPPLPERLLVVSPTTEMTSLAPGVRVLFHKLTPDFLSFTVPGAFSPAQQGQGHVPLPAQFWVPGGGCRFCC